jgi:hypothetical protein
MQRSLPTGAWIAGGLIVAALVVPGATYAAATLTQIVGSNGKTVAQVTKVHQLLTASAAPTSLFTSGLLASSNAAGTSPCLIAATTPGTDGLVLRQITYTVQQGGGSTDTLEFFSDSSCISPVAEIGFTPGNGVVPLEPGVTVPGAGHLYARLVNQTGALDKIQCFFDGYRVPAGAVAATSHLQRVVRVAAHS